MVLLHGIRTGTDSEVPWAAWYFRISAASLVILLAYRIYELSLKNRISLPKFSLVHPRRSRKPKMDMNATSKSPTRPSMSTSLRDLPLALLRAQAKNPEIIPAAEHVLTPIAIQLNAETELRTPEVDKTEQAAVVEETAGQQTPSQVSVPANESPISVVKKTVNGSVVTLEGTYQGKPSRVRIFGEPVTNPIPEQKESKKKSNEEIKPMEKVTLLTRLKNSFEKISVEPPSADRNSKHIVFSED
jgi:hypothetical protein